MYLQHHMQADIAAVPATTNEPPEATINATPVPIIAAAANPQHNQATRLGIFPFHPHTLLDCYYNMQTNSNK